MITPNSLIRFLKVPFSPSQNNVLLFPSVAAQTSYMEARIIHSIGDSKYQREGDGEFIAVNKNMDTLYNCNYVMFQNTHFSGKWFYAFIERMQYMNNNVTRVYLKIDAFQTFMFDHELKKTFIERQTVDVDYYNTLNDIPKGGELKTVYEHTETLNGSFFVLFNADPTTSDASLSPTKCATIGNYSIPCYMYFTNIAAELADLVQAVSNKGRADRIQSCYYAPSIATNGLLEGIEATFLPKGDLNLQSPLPSIPLIKSIPKENLYKDLTLNIPYTYEYKKELSYPYAKLEIVDKVTGKSIELDISKFSNPLSPQFRIITTITDTHEYKIIPLNYNGNPYSIENSLVIEPLTDMPVFSNSYAKYLKDNKVSNYINGGLTAAGIIGSVLTTNIAGAVGSFADVARLINANSVAHSQGNQTTGLKGDACDYLNFQPQIYFRLKTMDNDHLDLARNFWYSFGYPVGKVTNFVKTSKRFNYVKTVGCNIIADTIPSEYQRELESIYNNGVTLWNNNYLEY